MNTHNSYFDKLKRFIILATIFSQLFLCVTFLFSYFHYREKHYSQIASYQQLHYSNALDSLFVKIEDMLYINQTSGVIDLCSLGNTSLSQKRLRELYKDVQSNSRISCLQDHFFSGYVVAGMYQDRATISYIDDKFPDLNSLKLDMSQLLGNMTTSNLMKRYESIFIFNDDFLKDFMVCANPETYAQLSLAFRNKPVFFTVQENTVCFLILEEDFFHSIFSSTDINQTSIVLENNLGDVIYSKFYKKDADSFSSQKGFNHGIRIEKNGLILYLQHHKPITINDIILFIYVALICGSFIFASTILSNEFSHKIMEPYTILNNFFRLNSRSQSFEPFDYVKFSHSISKRTDISSNCFKTAIYTIILPSMAALFMLSFPMKSSICQMTNSLLSVAHTHIKNEFTDSIDRFIRNTPTNAPNLTNTYLKQRYSVSLNESGNLLVDNIRSIVDPNLLSQFQYFLRTSDINLTSGLIINIEKDLFGEHALGIVSSSADNSWKLDIIKSTTIENSITYSHINYVIVDERGSIITQNVVFDEHYLSKIIDGTANTLVYTDSFPELNWTIYTFYDTETLQYQTRYTFMMVLIIMLSFLIAITIVFWQYSIHFVKPIERIMSFISDTTAMDEEYLNISEQNEVYEMFYLYNQMIKHIEKLNQENLQHKHQEIILNAQIYQTKLVALQQQINPHFLSNTLEIASLSAMKHGDYNTSRIVSKLSKLLSYSFRSHSETTLLCDELENLRIYMDIWKLRFPDRFQYAFYIDPEVESARTLRLILQPLVENCFLHGFATKNTNCTVTISANCIEQYITITIHDNGCGMTEETLNALRQKLKNAGSQPVSGHGIGITNVCQRLAIQYKGASSLNVESSPKEGTLLTLCFPAQIN